MLCPRAPLEDVRRLRRLTDNPSLTVEFDEDESLDRDTPCWDVFYKDRHGRKVFLTSWHHTLDGTIGGLAERIRRLDRNYHSERDFQNRLDDQAFRQRRMARRRREAENEDFSEYAANAFRAYFKDGPNATVGWVGAGATGRA